MNYFALDTATDRPSLALGTPEDPGEDRVIAHRHDLSREIDVAAAELIAARGVNPRDLAGLIVADGPGSFTGLRIGIAFAKGFCRALDLPLLAAPSMLGAAWTESAKLHRLPSTVVVEYDALRGEVYRARYRITHEAALAEQPPTLVTRGAPLPPDALRAGEGRASAAALISLLSLVGGPAIIEDPQTWEPEYGRLAEAEARRRARHAAG